MQAQRKGQATFYSPAEEWILPSASTIKPEEREFVVDSGASMHMVSRKDLNSAELETVRTSKNPTRAVRANGEVVTEEEATEYVKEMDLFATVMLLEDTPTVHSLGKLCEEHGCTPLDQWSETTSKMAGKSIATQRLVHRQVLLLHPHLLPTSSSHDTVTTTEHPATERSESTSVEVQGNLSHEPAEIENSNNNDDNEEVRGNLSHYLPECLQEFRHGLVDESVLEHRDASSSSHELPLEPRAKEVSGKHSIFTHFPKERNCHICMRTKITKAYCRRRIGGVVPRAENFGDLMTADHKVLSESCESRNNHRFAVVVQDLATQWIQSHPCKTKTSQETQRSLQKFLEPTRKPKVIYTDNSLEFGKSCE